MCLNDEADYIGSVSLLSVMPQLLAGVAGGGAGLFGGKGAQGWTGRLIVSGFPASEGAVVKAAILREIGEACGAVAMRSAEV